MRATVLALVLLAAGGGLLGRDGYRRVKGFLATRLVRAATDAYLADGAAHRPWTWADFHPCGRLYVPRLAISRDLLAGGEGQTMAFGLGLVAPTAPPGEPGLVGLTGHRDSWGRFIGDLRLGDLVVVATAGGDRGYRVDRIAVVDAEDRSVLMAQDAGLTLVTCYPIGGVAPSRRRLVVSAVPTGVGPAASEPARRGRGEVRPAVAQPGGDGRLLAPRRATAG